MVSGVVASGATWWVHQTFTNDHHAVYTCLKIVMPLSLCRHCAGTCTECTSKFKVVPDQWWETYEPPEDLYQQERDLTAVIEKATKAAILRCQG